MRLNRFVLPVLAILALLGTALAAQAANLWTTSGRTDVDLAQLQPAEIKGWMTLQQVIDGLPISQTELYALAEIPADVPPETALKDLEEVVSVTELRDLLTTKLNLPVSANEAESSTTKPESTSTPILTTPAAATPIATTTHTSTGTGAGTGPTPLPAGQILPANQIKGRLTLHEVSEQCRVPFDQLLARLKLGPETDPNTALKDLIGAGQLADVTAVQKIVGELQK